MREIIVEQALVEGVERRGGIATKTRAIGRRGYFDRTVVLPGGEVWFVELKRPKGGRLAPHQLDFGSAYSRLGAQTVVLNSLHAVADFFRMIDSRTPPRLGTSAASAIHHPPR